MMRMCGILGYVGHDDVREIMLRGLKRLEYRGYDSAGVAVVSDAGVQVFKSQGKTSNLRQTDFIHTTSTVGIGHTRWATQGCVNLNNAHPHQSQSGRFTLVHNGVIQNEATLRVNYLADYPFKSETDSEVIVGLMDHFAKELPEADGIIQKLLTVLKGSYAFAVIDGLNPDVVYAVKNKAPLLIGVGVGFHMLGSDALSMSHCTKEFFVTDNKEYVKLGKNEVLFFNAAGEQVKKTAFTIDFNKHSMSKEDYPNHLLKEIHEQPKMIKRLVKAYMGEPERHEQLLSYFKGADRIYFVAGGTSLQSCAVGKALFEEIADIPVEVHMASEFAHHLPLLTKKPLFILVSASGESADGRGALLALKKRGFPVISMTNTLGSTLARDADAHIYLDVGCEIAVTTTKTYLAQLTLFAILAGMLAKNPTFDVTEELMRVSMTIGTMIESKSLYEEVANTYLTGDNLIYLGRHLDRYTAAEGALKLKELAYLHATGIAGGELKYGDLALIDENTVTISLLSDDVVSATMRGNMEVAKARGAKNLSIVMSCVSREDDTIIVGDVHPLLTPMVMIIPLQFLAYYAGIKRGTDVDRPRHLAKL